MYKITIRRSKIFRGIEKYYSSVQNIFGVRSCEMNEFELGRRVQICIFFVGGGEGGGSVI